MKTLSLGGRPFIALHNVLKLEGWVESGAAGKHIIDAGKVLVDGKVELRKRCKITVGQIVSCDGQTVHIIE